MVKEGRECHARDATEAYGVKSSVSVTNFVLAEGTHQTDQMVKPTQRCQTRVSIHKATCQTLKKNRSASTQEKTWQGQAQNLAERRRPSSSAVDGIPDETNESVSWLQEKMGIDSQSFHDSSKRTRLSDKR